MSRSSDCKDKAASLRSEAESLRSESTSLYTKYNETGDENIRQKAYEKLMQMQGKLDEANRYAQDALFWERYGE